MMNLHCPAWSRGYRRFRLPKARDIKVKDVELSPATEFERDRTLGWGTPHLPIEIDLASS